MLSRTKLLRLSARLFLDVIIEKEAGNDRLKTAVANCLEAPRRDWGFLADPGTAETEAMVTLWD